MTTTSPKPDHFADVAAALRTLAERFTDLIGSDLPRASVSLSVQPGIYRDDDIIVRAVDALTSTLLGHGAQVQQMSDGTYHYNNGDADEPVGAVRVRVLSSVSTEFAVKRQAAAVLAAKEAELEKLRAEVEAYRAAAKSDANGMGFSREPDDSTPVSGARMPHHESGGWKGTGPGGCGAECACGETFDGFDSLKEANEQLVRHIETATAEPTEIDGGLVDETEAPEHAQHWPGTPLVHMGMVAGDAACGQAVEPAERLSLLWKYVTCKACVDAGGTPAVVAEEPHDGHVYECCGKVGRLSRHEPWCDVYRTPDQSQSAT